MSDAILVINAGSSSIKFSVFLERGESLDLFLGGQLEGLYTAPKFKAKDAAGTVIGEKQWGEGQALGHDGAISHLAGYLREQLGEHRLAAVGHRVVHGGLDYAAPVRLTANIVTDLEKMIPLAPLHQPHNLKPICLLLANRPELPQVACFDTAFHRAQPAVAQAFALPAEITERGVRRYGFHGLSYEYIASALPKFDSRAASGRTVILHLGNGASMCAIQSGYSVASTMGFTAVDGLPMGTRCGSLDPGVVLYLMDELKMDTRAIEKLLHQQSGLLGVSGISSDMRTLLDSSDPKAKFAVELFVYRIGRELGSLAGALGGLDALVFTGGIGEHAAPIRERVCRAAAWLGVELNAVANATDGPRISTENSRIPVWVIPTNEELMIARHTRSILNQ
ncbi:acetate/propionate family kinase [Propionivibrio sp.]|uniref:acetate/propionate family kinase n=1 Tax=Propionivibrio sp. TaxID=2212460 RepID=UPI003BF0CF3F